MSNTTTLLDAKAEFNVDLGLEVESLYANPTDITNGAVLFKNYGNEKRAYWNGEGSFDVLIHGTTENIRIQYENGAITQTGYAEVLSQTLSNILSQSVQLNLANEELKIKELEAKLKIKTSEFEMAIRLKEMALREAELELKKQELDLKKKEMELKEKQAEADLGLTKLKQENIRANTNVLYRQAEGFNDNIKLKMLQFQMDAFAMIFSSGMLDFDQNNSAFPKALKSAEFNSAWDKAKDLTNRKEFLQTQQNRVYNGNSDDYGSGIKL